MARIHPTALIDAQAQLGADVEVAAYAVIGPHVRIDEGTTIGAHTVVEGHTTIGRDNRIFQFASIGGAPQDKKYGGEPTRLEIGHGNTIREFCTLNTGTEQDAGVTRIGDANWIMAYVHIAHDCQLGSHTIIANAVQLGGHVHVGDWAFLGGLSGDLPPYVTASGNPAQAQSINQEGLKRRGFDGARIETIKQLHRLLYRSNLRLDEALQRITQLRDQQPQSAADIGLMLDFLAAAARGIVR